MKNTNLLDQFFLIDEKIVKKMVLSLEISKKDSVLEIGAGNGVLTKEISKLASSITVIEIDKRFANELKSIPRVKVIIGDGFLFLKTLRKTDRVNKIISSLPSSLVEPIFLILPKVNFKIGVFLIPLKFVNKLLNNQIFNNYFIVEFLDKVSKTSFFPQPKTNWALVKIIKKENPLKIGDFSGFVKRYLLEHKNAKPKNALVEALIIFSRSQRKKLTKNQARKLIEERKINFYDNQKPPRCS